MNSRRSIALAVSTTFGGFVLAHFIKQPVNWQIWCILVVIGTGLLYSIGVLQRLHVELTRLERHLPFRSPKIGILHDIPWTDDVAVNTDITFTDWQARLQNQANGSGIDVDVRLVRLEDNLDMYHVVLNPYGGTYPESSVDKQESLSRILAYMRRGGVFVNVADIPGYFVYSTALRRNVEASSAHQTFFDVPFMKFLGLKVLNWQVVTRKEGDEWPFVLRTESEVDSSPSRPMRVTRVVQVQSGLTPIVAPHREFNGCKVTPVFLQQYGAGGMLASLLFLGQQWEDNRSIIDCLVQDALAIATGGKRAATE